MKKRNIFLTKNHGWGNMQTYLAIKPFIVAIVSLAGFGYFFYRIYKLITIMKAVDGTWPIQLDQLGDRIKVLFTDVLLQSNVRRKALIGLAHTSIFFAFLLVQPHTIETILEGVFHNFTFANVWLGGYTVYAFWSDIFVAIAILGLLYAAYRRFFIKPPYLTNGVDAKVILLFTMLLLVSFLYLNGFRLALQQEPFDAIAKYYPFSSRILKWTGMAGLSLGGMKAGLEISYWVHLFTVLGFVIYVPGSKHLHLLASIPNVFLKPLKTEKTIIKTDLEDENAENFGIGKVSDLNPKHVLDFYACTECGRCEERCPASNTGKPLTPKGLIHDLKVDLLDQSEKLLSKAEEKPEVDPLFRDGSPVTDDVIWSCTSCRACENICPVDIQHLDLIFEIRKNRVLMEAAFPEEVKPTFDNLENQANPWGLGADTRADWCKDLDVPRMSENSDVDVLYFVGCAGSFDDRGKLVARAIVSLLRKAGVSFAILGEEERCTGDSARRAGNEYLAQMLIAENVETLNNYKPKKILTGCPHCFNALANEYPEFGAQYDVVHYTTFFAELVKQGKLKFSDGPSEKITYHDSCYLGRWNDIYKAPRELLSAIKGLELKELPRTGDNGFCCGAGGARMFMEETLGTYINVDRAEEVIEAGVDKVATACPFCCTMLTDGITEKQKEIPVKDIAEILDEATV